MQLTEQETNVIKDLQTQEKACVDKYRFYEQDVYKRQPYFLKEFTAA